MFDPTVYENLKVIVEGAVYDLDIAGCVLVTNRTDRIELATMSRYYALSFIERDRETEGAIAEIRLIASMEDLSAEILEVEDSHPGCHMEIHFYKTVTNIEQECPQLEEAIRQIWQGRPMIKQVLSFDYGVNPVQYVDQIILDFGRKIDEAQVDDIPGLIDHMLHTVQTLNQMK